MTLSTGAVAEAYLDQVFYTQYDGNAARYAGYTYGYDIAVRLVTATGHERVHVVGHSLGGLLARWFVQKQGGDEVVDTLVTLGTPHGGTELARLAPLVPLLPMARQLTPGSSVVRGLAQPAPGCRTRFVAYASDIDHLVVPRRNARVEHPDLDATNVDVRGVGHLSMPNHRALAYEIADLLAAGRASVEVNGRRRAGDGQGHPVPNPARTLPTSPFPPRITDVEELGPRTAG